MYDVDPRQGSLGEVDAGWFGTDDGTLPIGAPFQTVPKSGCSPLSRPIDAMNWADCGWTGRREMSWFHGLSAGKIATSPKRVLRTGPAG